MRTPFDFCTLRNWSLLASVCLVLLSACKKDEEVEEPPPVQEQDPVPALIAEVRAETAAYDDHAAAVDAGWAVDLSGCVEHPTEGGMGHHFARMEYLDGRVNHLQPQVLLYEPNGEDAFTFIGVEYVVPFEILPADADPPVLFGQSFHANHTQEIWALHVWTERANPQGMFSDWNPDVSCQ